MRNTVRGGKEVERNKGKTSSRGTGREKRKIKEERSEGKTVSEFRDGREFALV